MTPAVFSAEGYFVKLCYCDESGTGEEPIATMAGIVVDASRMHRTKDDWAELLDWLSVKTGRQVAELHTREFYAGNGVFRGMHDRAELISEILRWLAIRKHHIVYSSVLKSEYKRAWNTQNIPDELGTEWRLLGFHLVLAMQKYCQAEIKTKGHTLFVFDNKEHEKVRFTDIITRPQLWSDEYYDLKKKQRQLDQVIDVPYFGDSIKVVLIQLADFIAFLLRRHAEIKEKLVGPKYPGEEARLDGWIKMITKRSIGTRFIYPAVGRNAAESVFYSVAPPSIRSLR